jgi:2-oxoglutarate ferredoxin oxidoreductase subunit alpha
MVEKRRTKVELIAQSLPELKVKGSPDADTLIVGWGGTYGHLLEAVTRMNEDGKKVALAHFQWINPLPKNTEEVLRSYKKIIVAELNSGQFAAYLRMKYQNLPYMYQINDIQGQPFVEDTLIEQITHIINEK